MEASKLRILNPKFDALELGTGDKAFDGAVVGFFASRKVACPELDIGDSRYSGLCRKSTSQQGLYELIFFKGQPALPLHLLKHHTIKLHKLGDGDWPEVFCKTQPWEGPTEMVALEVCGFRADEAYNVIQFAAGMMGAAFEPWKVDLCELRGAYLRHSQRAKWNLLPYIENRATDSGS